VPLNPRSRCATNYLEITSEDVFARGTPRPSSSCSASCRTTPSCAACGATTIRALGRHLWLIDEEFRQNPRHHRLFLDFMRAPQGVTHELRRMNLYGVLGRYIPAFGRIVGACSTTSSTPTPSMRTRCSWCANLRRLSLPRFEHEFPDLSRLMRSLPRPRSCCSRHSSTTSPRVAAATTPSSARWTPSVLPEQGLSRYDARLVAWLVRNHLLFSVTGRRRTSPTPR